MLQRDRIQAIARYNEKIAEKRFKKMGYSVRWLDHQGSRKRPEFLVTEPSGNLLVCEVKSLFSGGYLRDRSAHVSTMDPALLNTGVFSWDIDLGPMKADLSDAVAKYKQLVADEPEFEGLPLLVVFFFDEFADNFDFFPSKMDEHPEVSGIAVVERDAAIASIVDKMPLEELESVAKSGSMKGFPPNSKELRLVLNEVALNPLPEHFVESCLS